MGRPLCKHGNHEDGTEWCPEAKNAVIARLDLVRMRLGTDFETHGGKKVMYVGYIGSDWPTVPYGEIGTVESTTEQSVMVKWECTVNGIPKPLYAHMWKELEFLKTDDDGQISAQEIDRAMLKTAPRILALALPCPVCGSRKLALSEEYGYRHAFCTADYGKCGDPRPNNCGAAGPHISSEFPELMAITVWNIRGEPEALTKEIRGFPLGDVEVIPIVEIADVPDSPCPWCLGTRIRIGRENLNGLWHGQCTGCGGHGPWWPNGDLAKSAQDVICHWKKRGDVRG